MTVTAEQIIKIKEALTALEDKRTVLGNAVVDSAQASLKRELTELEGKLDTPEQHRKLATLLFVDVVDSTPLTHHLEPEEILEIMDSALKRLAQPVEQHGGHIARYQGDGFKAVFGVPVARENDPEQAVRAGLGVLAVAKEISQELEEQWGVFDFNVRIGINTGMIASGGKTEAHDTIMGEAVNLAARLEKAAPANGILISHNTYRHVRGVFRVNPLSRIEVKGFPEPIMIYQVVETKPRAFRIYTRGVEGLETRMVGRETELKKLKDDLLFTLEEREGKIITILGEAGIGKSRLLYEFKKWLELLPKEQDVYFFKGRARPEIQNLPYGLSRGVLSFRLQIHESDTVDSVREKISTGIGDVLGSDEIGIGKAHVIGQLLGFDFRDSPYVKKIYKNAQLLRERGFKYIKEYFLCYSSRRPVVIFLEDVHWADDSSLDLVNMLADVTASSPILILCLARPQIYECRPYWGEGHPQYDQIRLQPLNKRESYQLVGEILKYMDHIPETLGELLVSLAEGNPFFIEELVKMLIDQGVINKVTAQSNQQDDQRNGEHWEATIERLGEVEIPATLTGVLQARIDSLAPIEKMVLQFGSVIGRVFWDGAMVSASEALGNNLTSGEVERALTSLRNKNLIYHREQSAFSPAQEYIFQHSLLRDVTYENLTKRSRRAAHSRVAEWLIDQSGDRVGEYTGLIAEHLVLAGNSQLAVEYLVKAGDQARSVYAHPEAERHYQQAIELMHKQGELEAVARTLLKLGLVYTAAFETEKARKVYEEAFSLKVLERAPLRDGRLEGTVLSIAAELPVSFDPGLINDDVSTFYTNQLFEGLVRIGEDHNVLPAMAASWEISADGRTYLFHLRDDIFWSDGTTVSATDFEFALKRNLNPELKSPYAHLLYPIENARAYGNGEIDDVDRIGVKACDASTLQLRLENPCAYLPYLLAQSIAFALPRGAIERHGDNWTHPNNLITNGAYQLAECNSDEGYVLFRNPYYYGKYAGNVDRIEFIDFGSYLSKLDAYESDEVDLVTLLNADPEAIARAIELFGDEIVRIQHPSTLFLNFRVDKPPLDDRRVRKAFIMSMDRERLVAEAFSKQRLPAMGGFIPPGMPGHSPNIGLAYDPQRARQLLSEAGYPSGNNFPQISWLHSPGGGRVTQFLRALWQEHLGIDLMPDIVEDWEEFLNKLNHDPGDLMLSGWSADYPDPDFMMRLPFHSKEGINFPCWDNPHFDAIISEASWKPDHQRRMLLYQEADRILVRDEAVVMPLTYGERYMLVKPRVNLPRKPLFPVAFKNFWLENPKQ